MINNALILYHYHLVYLLLYFQNCFFFHLILFLCTINKKSEDPLSIIIFYL